MLCHSGKEVASGLLDEKVVLPAMQKTKMKIVLSTQFIQSDNELAQLFQQKQLNLDYHLKGKLNTSVAAFPLGIPFSNKGNIWSKITGQ